MSDIVEQYKSMTKDLGCSDGGCIFTKNTGMVTNGGCSCYATHRVTKPEIMRLRHMARLALEMSIEIERLQEALAEVVEALADMAGASVNELDKWSDESRTRTLWDCAVDAIAKVKNNER